jgi:hypothetical protein
VITFRAKVARGQLTLAPILPTLALHRQRLTRLYVQDDLIDLGTVQRALDA